MTALVFGGGDLAHAFWHTAPFQTEVLSRRDCDVRDFGLVTKFVAQNRPELVVCTAGLSDRRIGVSVKEVVDTNLLGAMHVGTAAAAYRIPCILVASTAGIDPGQHVWYGAAKAGVINFVRASANKGHRIWAVSPGRMDTKMREEDWPGEDRKTRLSPYRVAAVMHEIARGLYAPGANVVVRKVGLERVEVYEQEAASLPSML